jgi:NTE family protein
LFLLLSHMPPTGEMPPKILEPLSVSGGDARSKTAFVFAGGGSFGAIHVGMLHALARRGIAADMVVGSSVGALNGALLCGQPHDRRDPTTGGDLARIAPQRGVSGVVADDHGLFVSAGFSHPVGGLRQLVDQHLTYRNLEDAKVPVHIVATDILSGGTVVLSEGSAAQAIIASAAIPAAFAPVHFNDLYLADGAVSSNTPVTVAVARGARRLIVLPTGYACALDKPPVGVVANALHALTLLIARQLMSELQGLDRSIEYFVLPPLCPLVGSPYDFSRTGELIERAARSTDAWLTGGGLDRPGVHAQLSTHKHKPPQRV